MNPIRAQLEEQIRVLKGVRYQLGLNGIATAKLQNFIEDLQGQLLRMPSEQARNKRP